MSIDRILLIIIIIYLIISNKKKNKNIEKFAVTDDIKAAVKEIYNSDMESVRQLAIMSQKLLAGGLEIPGNVKITGNLEITGAINNGGAINSGGAINCAGAINCGGNVQSKGEIKTLDTNNNEKASLNNVLSSLNSSVSSINTSLGTKIDNNASISLEDVNRANYKLSSWTIDDITYTSDKPIKFYSWGQKAPLNYKWKISKV